MKLTWLSIDVDCQECDEASFSSEYIRNNNTHQFTLYLPLFVLQVKAKWEE